MLEIFRKKKVKFKIEVDHLSIMEALDTYDILSRLIKVDELISQIALYKKAIIILLTGDEQMRGLLLEPQFDTVFSHTGFKDKKRLNYDPVPIINDINQKIAYHFDLGDKGN